MTKTKDFLQIAKDAAQALDLKFGKEITVLDISNISTIADFFIITSASSPNQMQAMIEGVEEAMAKHGVRIHHIEGQQRADWILMDYGDFIIHMFNEESRVFYDLERTWRDSTVVDWE